MESDKSAYKIIIYTIKINRLNSILRMVLPIFFFLN